MVNLTLIVPIVLFIITSYVIYHYSNDPQKSEKPMNFIFPGVAVAVLSFIAMKYKDNFTSEPMMQGNYFD
jgi:uncharacterized BrkB/YihY/UPF0761 family membrane protein